MDHLFNQFFRLDLSQCYFPIGIKHFLSLFGRNTGFCNSCFQGSQGMLICKCGPGLQLAMWLWRVKTYVVTLCKMLNFIIFLHGLKLVFRTSQYATMWLPLHGPGTVLVFSIINSSNFIHFTCLRVVSRDFLDWWMIFMYSMYYKFFMF